MSLPHVGLIELTGRIRVKKEPPPFFPPQFRYSSATYPLKLALQAAICCSSVQPRSPVSMFPSHVNGYPSASSWFRQLAAR